MNFLVCGTDIRGFGMTTEVNLMRVWGGALVGGGREGKEEKEEGREELGGKKGHPCCVNQTPAAPSYCKQKRVVR